MGEDQTADGESVGLAGALEFALAEWGLSPDYILDHWTSDLFELMAAKAGERIRVSHGGSRHKPSKMIDRLF